MVLFPTKNDFQKDKYTDMHKKIICLKQKVWTHIYYINPIELLLKCN